ncbi:MAG: PVC-type heme-binding CxxCH protein [Isosphaeraceae bacterium]
MWHRVASDRSIADRLGVILGLGLAGLLLAPAAASAQSGAEESVRKLKPAEGLEATLWASEPMLSNPTNMDIDSRGRVWVTEGLNYRLTRGGNRKFHRVEEADRIKILEDTDHDGKADKVTVFADRIFPVPMGIAVEEHYDKAGKYTGCKVFVGNSPDLLVLEDTDGDDRADKRYPLLTGFGGVDSDHGVHGMFLGFDGKLYFSHGDGCCSVQHDHSERQQNFDVTDKSGRHVWTDQLANTLRVNRDGTQFEIICDRQRNNYETCQNSFGIGLTSDNDDDGNRGCRVIWTMDGGHYGYRTPGSPRHWGEEVPGNVPKLVGTGNGSPCGIMVYEGNLLPPEYRGGVLEVDAGTRQVNFFPITRHGASFRTVYKVFLGSDDPWFRPVDACAAPDGSIFVADWYDAGVGGHAFRDQTTGRIYRVAPKGHKATQPKADFATDEGLVAALRSPNVATADAARRGLIDRVEIKAGAPVAGADVLESLGKLAMPSTESIARARILWTIEGIYAQAGAANPTLAAILQGERDPRIREMAVRMLGRDCRDNGHVQLAQGASKLPPRPAEQHLKELLPLADDPDAGVRRELILAFRNLPTDQVGDALRKLAASWDGQDRWYLEALGLALDGREPAFIARLFDGTLYGNLDLDRSGRQVDLALPPYFPVDRNEAYIAEGTPDEPASALSKSLGLGWRLHRRESLALLERVFPSLRTAELQQAADDILEGMHDLAVAEVVANLTRRIDDPLRRNNLYAMLAERLSGEWGEARNRPWMIRLIGDALARPDSRVQGIAMAAATKDARYRGSLEGYARDAKLPIEARVAAVEGLGSLSITPNRVPEQLVAAARGKSSSDPVAEAAVRVMARHSGAASRLSGIVTARDYPLGLRREALRGMASLQDGGYRVVELARAGKLPPDLKNDATALLYASPVRGVREAAAKVLPLPKMAGGRSLPPIGELLRREGNADRGRQVFFREGANACSSCHRVQGRGHWVGPDLSTIGVKYGRDELVRSILSPSAAIGYNFRSVVVALNDGRVITGLPIEETSSRLVLKTATGERVVVPTGSIEDRRTSDVSLMPEGLAQTLTDAELVDLIAYLATLRQPVAIVGQYHVLGPLQGSSNTARLEKSGSIDIDNAVDDGHGRRLNWRRVNANAEGLVDVSALAGGEDDGAGAGAGHVYLYAPLVSPVAQRARLVIEAPDGASAWLNGQPLSLAPAESGKSGTRETTIDLHPGPESLLIRLPLDRTSGSPATLVTTIVADQPVGFATR